MQGVRPVPILMYHSISETASRAFRSFAVSPAHFAEQMGYLKAAGYTALTVSEYVRLLDGGRARLPARPVVLTFDDGFADFTACALPILQHHGLTGTLYLTTGYVGATSRWLSGEGEGERPMLGWEDVLTAQAAGIECGAHSHTHVELDTVSANRAAEEIFHSKRLLEDHLERRVETFAYPYGYHNHWSRGFVNAAGFTSACAVKFALSSTADDPYQLARVKVSSDTTMEQFVGLIEGRRLPVAPTGERLRTRVWAVIRHARARLKPRATTVARTISAPGA